MKIKCERCGRVHEIDVDWQQTGTDSDRGMGPEYFYNFSTAIDCDCGTVIDINLERSEYPLGDGIKLYANDIKNGGIIDYEPTQTISFEDY
jgi:hypothetical protein